MTLKIPPLLLTALFLILIWLCARFTGGDWTGGTLRWLALIPLIAGAMVALLGVVAFRRASTTVDPRYPENSVALVTGGVYRLSRNPMYLGFLLWLLAGCLWSGNPFTLLLCPLFVLYMNRFQIIPEEQQLQRHFGEPFQRYCQRVRRWL